MRTLPDTLVLFHRICSVVLVGVSLLGPAPSDEALAGLTFATAKSGQQAPDEVLASDPSWRSRDVVLTGVLLLCVAAVWIYFR